MLDGDGEGHLVAAGGAALPDELHCGGVWRGEVREEDGALGGEAGDDGGGRVVT